MKETQLTISDWGHKTFGYPKNYVTIIKRMLKECKELEELIDNNAHFNDALCDDIVDECADIYIVMCHVMTTIGYDLHACVDHKMEINRARKWNINGDGTGQHVKE